ncbi:MAG: acyl-CoA dehydrogenase family protein, partial [Lysobacterales bacterium]
MKPFVAPASDILFSLQQVAGARRLDGWDEDLTAEVVGQFARFAEQELAPLNAPGDQSGCRIENGRVAMPAGFRAAYRAYTDQGWPGLSLPRQYGGQGMPASLMGAVMEIFAGANHSLQMLCGLVGGAARTILAFGTDRQKRDCLPHLASGDWLATMCMTEADAGSDLSRIRTRAVKDGPVWRISGEKIFISGGDQDMSEGIL